MRRLGMAVTTAGSLALGCGGGGGGGGSSSAPGAPSPVATSTPASTIGAAGGTLTAAGGQARLVIPAGALSGDVALTLVATPSVPLDPQAVAGTAFELAPPVSFATPARLFLRIGATAGPSGVDPGEFRVHSLASGRWEPAGRSETFDRAGGEVSADVSGGGVYGLRWPGPATRCEGEAHRQFDFWLGSWTFRQVLPASSGTATNDISRDPTGCLILEDFHSAGHGASVSLVSPLDGLWHQTYIDSQGQRLLLVGHLEGDRMILQQSPTQRFVWHPREPDRIRYYGERTVDGANWVVFFDSFYTTPG